VEIKERASGNARVLSGICVLRRKGFMDLELSLLRTLADS